MRKWRWGGLSGLAYLVLLGCAQDLGPLAKEQPAQLIAMLQTGRPLLTCRDACLDAWRAVQPQVAQFNASGRWQELAVLVLRTGYQDDLTLYYLGRAAEGLGYPVAAASYYRQSAGLSGTSVACAKSSRQCGGVSLPSAAAFRLAAVERGLNEARYRRSRAPPGLSATSVAAPTEVEKPAPAEWTTPASSEAEPPPKPARRPAHLEDYIEPPPAPR